MKNVIHQIRRSFMRLGKTQRHIVGVTTGVLLAIVGFQLIYPSDRALPFARLNDQPVGTMSHSDIHKRLIGDYGETVITTRVNSKTIKTPLAETGLIYDGDRITRGLSDLPWYLRVIPFSAFIKGALTDQPVVMTVDAPRFSLYAAQRAKDCAILPKNASVVARGGNVVLDPARDGAQCTSASLKSQLVAVPLQRSGVTIALKTSPVKPERSDADVAGLLRQANIVASRVISIDVAGKRYDIDKPTLASWLAFPEDPSSKKLTVGINSDILVKYLESIQKDVYIAPGTTAITTRDGIETARVSGSYGRGIDTAKSAAAITTQILAGSGTATALLTDLPPRLVYNRSYSKTPEGLQALVNDLVKDNGDFAISVRRLGDTGVHASGDKQYHPASTYKLFVAYSVLKRIDAGQLSWGQPSSGGQTIEQCFDAMIVRSDNACAEWLSTSIGWSVMTGEVRAHGLSRTNLSSSFVTTTNDLSLFLQKLESGTLGISEPSRARLLDAMRRQVFRQGIPAGVGVSVADKVGFLDGNLHDAALVYGPSGVYVLTIMSKGSSWATIADAASQIHAQIQ